MIDSDGFLSVFGSFKDVVTVVLTVVLTRKVGKRFTSLIHKTRYSVFDTATKVKGQKIGSRTITHMSWGHSYTRSSDLMKNYYHLHPSS